MKILIGGSPGTGSSLLRQMLNRHPAIYCGPETQLFTHPVLFRDWQGNKGRLISRPRLRAPGVYPLKGCRLAGREQQWTEREVQVLINKSDSIGEFCDMYFSKPLSIYEKQYWGEKTPDNVLSFGPFLEYFSDGVVILIVRDPLDTIASLIDRGFTIFSAIARYLFNNSIGLREQGASRFHRVSYESLVQTPGETLTVLFDSMGMPITEEVATRMCQPGNPMMSEDDKLKGWRTSELDKPRVRSIGRFHDQAPELRDLILNAIDRVNITENYADANQITHTDIRMVAHSLGYELPSAGTDMSSKARSVLKKGMRLHRWNALKARHLFFEKENPVEIE